MLQKRERPTGPVLLQRLSWDETCAFPGGGRPHTAAFRKAATGVGMSSSTVVRRMERLEETQSVLLFNRLPEGVALTVEGSFGCSNARRTADGARQLIRPRAISSNQYLTTRGTVRCAIT